jgi:hypothetical protein
MKIVNPATRAGKKQLKKEAKAGNLVLPKKDLCRTKDCKKPILAHTASEFKSHGNFFAPKGAK